MAREFTTSDSYGLAAIAELWDAWFKEPRLEVLKEIRLQEHRFGLDPASRRSLQWELPDEPQEPSATPDAGTPPPAPRGDDPRKVLRMVVGKATA